MVFLTQSHIHSMKERHPVGVPVEIGYGFQPTVLTDRVLKTMDSPTG